MAAYTTSMKRSGAPMGTEPTKKRAPYASRACDACRRRKGRCSGDNPCTYCVARSLRCDRDMVGLYNREPNASSEQPVAGPATPAPTSASEDSRAEAASITAWQPAAPMSKTQDNSWGPNTSAIGELLASLQEQVGTLASRMESMERNSEPVPGNMPNPGTVDNTVSTARSSEPLNTESKLSPRERLAVRKTHRRHFCGPTSPDYSLNVAQIRMHQGDPGFPLNRPRLPSIDDNNSADGESVDDFVEADGSPSAYVSSRTIDKLTAFRRLLAKQETLRLMHTYQEVFGDFHPILDIDALVRQVEAWYDPAPVAPASSSSNKHYSAHSASGPKRPPTDEFSLLKINLVLAIALCAEATSDPGVAKEIYGHCRDVINRKLVSPAPGVKHVTVALLVGTYHFFRDDPRFGWRMCGLAGNMLLELGLHSRDIPEQILGSEHERAQVVAIICTTIVLDRQWSAATGLPTHFQESHFHHAMKSSVESPYLRAMVSFMAVSDKFTSLISRIATTNQPYEDDDTFEILNFQIEQWRKNAVGNYNLAQHGAWRTTPIGRIPSWAVLLNLRANAAHALLLRPFFFTNKPTAVSKQKIEPALHFVSDTINVLSKLDKSTDIYRKQQPFYIHLLVSACALMSLVIAHVAQDYSALGPELPEDFAESVSKSFRKALSLATAYNGTSRASRKLWKRLVLMREPLVRLNILPRESQPAPLSSTSASVDDDAPLHMPTWSAREARNPERIPNQSGRDPSVPSQAVAPAGNPKVSGDGSGSDPYQSVGGTFVQDLSVLPATMGVGTPAFDSGGANAMLAFGTSGPMFGDWPLVDGHTFFSEGELLYEE